MTTILAVALGGGVGTALRYIIAAPLNDRSPGFGTAVVNVAGSLVLGVLLGWFSTRSGNSVLRIALGAGVLGGFTTFSAWSVELVDSLDRPGRLLVLLVGPVVLGLAAAWIGIRIGRAV
ncbi:MAG: CrcB family protein [Acidimicrobiia bacterium]|nr:CrcB family protein [Acidimicrobiia bacterium]